MGGREEGRKGVEREGEGIERAKGGRKGREEEKGGEGREDKGRGHATGLPWFKASFWTIHRMCEYAHAVLSREHSFS